MQKILCKNKLRKLSTHQRPQFCCAAKEKEAPKGLGILKGFIIFFAAWIILFGLTLYTFEFWPKNLFGWIVAVVLGPLGRIVFYSIIIMICYFAHTVLHRIPFIAKLGANVQEQGKGRLNSLTRMGYFFIELVCILFFLILLFYVLAKISGVSINSINSFFDNIASQLR